MTEHSSCCDLISFGNHEIEPGQTALVPTNVWIESYTPGDDPDLIEELQIRCRSSFPVKKSLMLPNGIGTIDADYRDEIRVLLYNFGTETARIEDGERIAQMALCITRKIEGAVNTYNARTGGFGSTNP